MALCSSSFAGEIPEEPVITVSPYNWSTQSVRMGDPSKKRQLDLELKVTMKAAEESGWKIACCGVGEGGLKLADSEGSSCPGMECCYDDSPSLLEGLEKGKTITLSTESWLPSADAKWMEVSGKIPFFICRASFMSESVSLKMEEGSSVPLVLRNAGSDGGDVDAVLEVVPYKVIGSQGFVSLRLFAPSKIGFLGANVESEDGAVLPVDGPSEYDSRGSGPSRQEILLDHELPGGGHQRGGMEGSRQICGRIERNHGSGTGSVRPVRSHGKPEYSTGREWR